MERMVLPVIVGVQFERGTSQLSRASREVIQGAASITDGPIWALSPSPEPDPSALGERGVERLFVSENAGRLAAASADLINAAISENGPVGAVLLPGTYWGKETAAHLSALLDAGVSIDVDQVSVEDGLLAASKSILGGSWDSEFKIERGVPVIALSGSAKFTEKRDPVDCVEVPLAIEVRPEIAAVVVESAQAATGDAAARLSEAEVAVIGGRGAEENFALVGALANSLGGAVGATRVACDEGWVDRSLQVGQTGVTISPRVYVGVGVSGAIHHTCGMQGAEVVVAICDDPDAPIFEIADFGIVGDVNEVLPQAIKALGR